MSDYICDKTTGRQLAWITDGKVFDVNSSRQIATLRNGSLYALDGKLVGHVENAFQVRSGKTPAAFLNLLKAT